MTLSTQETVPLRPEAGLNGAPSSASAQRTHRVPFGISAQASAHLNMLRGLAALAVLFGHWRNIFFVDWPQVDHRNLFLALCYGSTKFGHEAVIVFFVLSGFLIGRSVLRTNWAGRWSARHYAFHRLVRLELVLLPALVLCWLWDTAGIHLFSPSPTYLGTSGSAVLLSPIPSLLNLRTFFGNMAFLQTIVVPCFGSDQSLWSLANEFWYYVLFPCLVIALIGRSSWFRRACAVALFVGVAVFIGKGMLEGFLVWLLGAALVFVPAPKRLKNRAYISLVVLAGALVIVQLILTMAPGKPERGLNTDLILGLAVAAFMYLLLHFPHRVNASYTKVADRTAGFSYTLYLTHLPVLVFFSALLNHRAQPGFRNLLIPLAILGFTVAYSYVIAILFEHRTDRVRKALEAKFHL